MKPKFLLINSGGDFEGLALQLKKEGCDFYFYRGKDMVKGREDTGFGLIDKEKNIDEIFEALNKEDKENLIILFDDNGYGDTADYLKNDGWKVIGASAFADKIEYERSLGEKIFKKIGLNVPPSETFNSIDDGIKFIEKQKDDVRFVFKPEGSDCAGSAKTYTGKNKKDLIDYLKWIKGDIVSQQGKDGSYQIEKFIMQEFIDGEEADFSAYFDGEKFMDGSINVYMEEKKSGDGNKGEAVGCMGAVCFYTNKSKYFDEYMVKLTPLLKKIDFVGQISINNIFSLKDGMPYGLEFTPRFGWDSFPIESQLIKDKGTLSGWLYSIANKKPYKYPTDKIGCGVRIYTGSVDLKKHDVTGRYFSFDKSVEDNLYFYSTSYKDGSYLIEDNPVMVVNNIDTNLKKSIDGCYEKIKKVNIPDIYYRTEIGDRADRVIKFLRKYGWI